MDAESAKHFITDLDAELQEIKGNTDELKLNALYLKVETFIRKYFGADSEYIKDLSTINFLSFNGEDWDLETWNNGWGHLSNLLKLLIYDIDLSSSTSEAHPKKVV